MRDLARAPTPTQIETAMTATAYKYTNAAAYESGSGGTASSDKGHGLVDVVAAAQQLTAS